MRFAKPRIRNRANGARESRLRLGFVPTLESSPLIAARELGIFAQRGLEVELSREVGWATIREKLLHEEIDAAVAPAGMAWAIYCGLGAVRRSCLTGLLLGGGGGAITLSRKLRDEGVHDAESLARVIRSRSGAPSLTFGVPHEYSPQRHSLQKWLQLGGLDPLRDARVTVIPPGLMYESFRQGYLDGFCGSEPWNRAAIEDGIGWTAARTSEIDPEQPQLALLVLREFAGQREDEHLSLIAALIEAGQFCSLPANRPALARLLARAGYFEVAESLIERALDGLAGAGPGPAAAEGARGGDILGTSAPTRSAGRRALELVRALSPREAARGLRVEAIAKVFRGDLYAAALERRLPRAGGPVDPGSPEPTAAVPRGRAVQPAGLAPAARKSLAATGAACGAPAFAALAF